jgi:hypothetical protein
MRGDAAGGLTARTLRIMAAHPNIVAVRRKDIASKTGTWEAEADIRLGLPNAWMAEGRSPNGVHAIETVTFWFPAGFPLRAPVIRLRADFDRSLAHVQPDPPNKPPRPCIFDGNLAELLQQQGIAGILNQLVLWLENAAFGRLIDSAQGWEPVRRDELADFIVADAGALRALVRRKEGFALFAFEYAAFEVGDGPPSLHGEIGRDRLTLNAKTIGAFFRERSSRSNASLSLGRSVAIVAWPGRDASGAPIVAGRYEPETVTDVASLKARAADYGCAAPLESALRRLESCLGAYQASATFPVIVILCARRPFHLIGSGSAIELCPYVVEISAPTLLPAGDKAPVRPAGHRQAITPGLLQRLSGGQELEPLKWIQLGCGSLGSKIALHLARAGRAPSTVIDRGYLSPHNAARHALVPGSSQMQVSWLGSKAKGVADAIEALGQKAEAATADIIAVIGDNDRTKKTLPKRAWAIVNATASLTAREALGSVPQGTEIPRVIETVLFGAGSLGVLTVEGPSRNPDTLDLMAETYALAREDDVLRDVMFAQGAGLTRQSIGEGCGSATMVMSDARLSMFAAPMAEAIADMQNRTLPDRGRVLIGAMSADGLGMGWKDHVVPAVVVVPAEGQGPWRIRMSARAVGKMEEEVRRWPRVETGGILMGRISEAARSFYVTDVLPAPDDSIRTASGFVLGTRGARATIADYAESCGYSLFCLGTWHSHLMTSGPSSTDRATAAAVALARLAPSVLVIHTPSGFRALLADGWAEDEIDGNGAEADGAERVRSDHG